MSFSPDNPYAVNPTSFPQPAGASSDVEAIRKKYLSHEASVKSIGLLYWLGGIFGALLAPIYLVGGAFALTDPDSRLGGALLIVFSFFVGGMAALQIAIALGLGKLVPWSRIGATIVSCIGLIGFPIGTLISAYFLYLLLSQKGV